MRAVLFSVFVCFSVIYAEESEPSKDYFIRFSASSHREEDFLVFPPNETRQAVLSSDCGKVAEGRWGIFEHTYKIGSAAQDELCTWKVHAFDNHVVHVLSIIFYLRDEISPKVSDDIKTTSISFYDGNDSNEDKLLMRLYASPQEKVGSFVNSTSHGQDMVIELKYHENKDFAKQQFLISYVFVPIDKVKAVLGDSW